MMRRQVQQMRRRATELRRDVPQELDDFAAMGLSDQERLAKQFSVYHALYAYVQSKHE